MAQIAVKKLTNANVYVGNSSYLGKAAEIDLPKITAVMAEHQALGMVGKIDLPSGFEKMEARIKWNSMYPDAMKRMANPFEMVSLQCRSSLEDYTAGGRTGQVPVVCFMKAQFKEVPMGNFKQHENVELESQLTVTYVKLEIDGQSIVEFDALANIYKVDGVDILAQYRANIGG